MKYIRTKSKKGITVMFYVIDIRDDDIRWIGTEKECEEWISMSNPMNRQYYKLAKENEKGELELL